MDNKIQHILTYTGMSMRRSSQTSCALLRDVKATEEARLFFTLFICLNFADLVGRSNRCRSAELTVLDVYMNVPAPLEECFTVTPMFFIEKGFFMVVPFTCF